KLTEQPQIDPNKADAHYEELKKLIEKLTEQPQIDPNKADAHYKELKKLIEKLTEQIKPLSQIDQVKFIKKTDTAVSQAVGLLKQADNKFETLDETIHHFGKNSEEKLETISEQLKDLEIAPTIKEIDIKRISAVTSEEIEQKLKNLRRGISRATLKKEIVKILKDTHDSDLIKNTDDLISSIEDKKEILSDLLTHTLDKSGGFGNFAGRIEKVEKELKLFKKKFPDHLAHILPILLAKTLDRSEIFPNLVRKIEVIENKLDRFEIMNNISDILVDALDKSAIFNNLMKSIQNIEDKFSDFSQPDHKSRKQ
ncbi:MAG: hypothetical protein GY795_39760, partial [Desulfobacterales bacterium]|nr:hypothetical protein [Desulfobacterales bacterium]